MQVRSTAPTRISLFGGGTDVGEYAEKYGGICLNFAINIRQVFTIDTQSTIHSWLQQDSLDFINSLITPYRVGEMGIRHDFDGEIESGLGSSAAAAVALVGAVDKIGNLGMPRSEIAEKAWDIEVNKVGLFGGKQDQYCSAFGGVNVMEFKKNVEVTPLSTAYLSKVFPCLSLFYLGNNRKSPKIQEGLKKITSEQKEHLDKIKSIAFEAITNMEDPEKIGHLLNLSWNHKKLSNKGVTNENIDKIYEKAIKLGSWGGKVLGAGSGGHILFISPPDKKIKLEEDLGLKNIDFSICWNGLEVKKIR